MPLVDAQDKTLSQQLFSEDWMTHYEQCSCLRQEDNRGTGYPMRLKPDKVSISKTEIVRTHKRRQFQSSFTMFLRTKLAVPAVLCRMAKDCPFWLPLPLAYFCQASNHSLKHHHFQDLLLQHHLPTHCY